MKLEKEHRESFIWRLEKLNEEIEITKSIILKSDDSDRFQKHRDIDLFLLEEEKKLIEKSLINNEIDW
jgi:hypothetical protein